MHYLQHLMSRFPQDFGCREFENKLGDPGNVHEQSNELNSPMKRLDDEMLLPAF